MIYAIRAVGTKYIKFGYTSNRTGAEKRMSELQTGNPFQLEIVAYGPGDHDEEAHIHWRLEQVGAHVRGEWFEMCEMAEQIIWEIKHRQKNARPDEQPSPRGRSAAERLGRVIEFARSKSAALSVGDDRPTEHPAEIPVRRVNQGHSG